jgi:hemerythrin-like domain-containing protein
MTIHTHEMAFKADKLRADHRTFERRFADICRRAREGDWHDLDAVWGPFTRDIEDHLAFEEREVFPAYCHEGPECRSLVEALTAQHAEIRRTLERLGLEIQLKAVRAPTIEAFIELMRRHATIENARIYPWLASADLWRSMHESPSAAP